MRLGGRIDLEAYPRLKKTIHAALHQSSRLLLINMTDVILISSSGVGALVNLGRDLEKAGGRMALVELSAVASQVIDFLRLDDVLHIFATQEQGLAYLRQLA